MYWQHQQSSYDKEQSNNSVATQRTQSCVLMSLLNDPNKCLTGYGMVVHTGQLGRKE
jgi:hypothetical protein